METNTAVAAVAGNEDCGGGGKNSNSNAASFMCRQSSTRWTPTTEQIRILKDLYYNNGVRSPTAEQIQRISAKLRQYGKIEGKNVFYWFQNHKARERQKKRFTTDHIPTINNRSITNPVAAAAANNSSWKHNNEDNHHLHLNPTPFYSFLSVGSAGRNYGYGSIAMEKSFRDCSITPSPVIVGGWGGVDPYYHPLDHNALQQTLKMDAGEEEDDDDREEDDAGPEIETLPLFPMHGEIGNRKTHEEYLSPWPAAAAGGSGGCSRASVELTLNSYGSSFPDFP